MKNREGVMPGQLPFKPKDVKLEAWKPGRVFIMVLVVMLLASCASMGAKQRIQYDAAYANSLVEYGKTQKLCFSDGDVVNGVFLVDQCPISVETTEKVDRLIALYNIAKDVPEGEQNSCQLASVADAMADLFKVDREGFSLSQYCFVQDSEVTAILRGEGNAE